MIQWDYMFLITLGDCGALKYQIANNHSFIQWLVYYPKRDDLVTPIIFCIASNFVTRKSILHLF